MLAQGVLRHLPGGVKVMAFGKEIEAPDTQRRITGLKETLGDTMTILEAVKEDKGDRMVAWANMEEIIQKRPEIAALIGLEPYHIPAMARAVTEGGRARMVRVIGMGPAPDMEELLKKGIAHAIIVDDARGYGAVALQTLVALAQGEKEELPEDGNIVVAPLALETESVMSVKEMMNELQVQAPWISETTPGVP